jgi:hypothetical protein
MIPSRQLNLEMEQFAYAQLFAKGDLVTAVEIASNHDWSRAERVLRAAVNSGSTTDSGWAGSLVDYRTLSNGFLDSLRAISAIDAMAPFAMSVPPKRRVAISTTALTGSIVTEGTVKPVTRLAIGLVNTEPTTAMTLVVLSDEVMRLVVPAALAMIKRELGAGVAAAANDAFLGALAAAAATAANIGATSDYLVDLQAALLVVATHGSGNYFAIVSPSVAAALSTDERSAFDNMTPNGGTIRGVRHLVSDALESGDVIVVDAGGLAIDTGTLTLAASSAAALQLDDDPAEGAQNLTSLFQTNSVALRAERVVSFEVLRASAVALITDPSYGANSP